MLSESLPRTRSEDLNVLSSIVSEGVKTYLDRLQQTGYPKPTLEDPIPEIVKDTEAHNAKLEILRACERIMALVQGPVEWFMFQNMAFMEPSCVAIAIDLGIPEHIAPGPEPTSLAQLVEITGAASELIERVMRVCTQRLCFVEIAPGQYIHNGVSLSLLIPPIGALIGHCTEDALFTGGKLLDTLREEKFQISSDPSKAAFSKARDTKLGMFPYFDQVDPKRGERFALGMAGSELIRPLTEDVYPFEQLPEGAKLVDVGGGRGQVSIRIAEKVSHLSFVVQDQASVVESVQAEGGLDEMDNRVEFQAHNFFTEQPVKGADAYLFRFILHDHPDSACTTILRQIVKAMDPVKSRILIDDAVVPGLLGPESLRIFNLLDMYMLGNLNGKERTEKQWRELFKAADERLVVEKIWLERNGGLQGGRVIELRLQQDQPNGANHTEPSVANHTELNRVGVSELNSATKTELGAANNAQPNSVEHSEPDNANKNRPSSTEHVQPDHSNKVQPSIAKHTEPVSAHITKPISQISLE